MKKVLCQALAGRGRGRGGGSMNQIHCCSMFWETRCYTVDFMHIKEVLSGGRLRYESFRSPEARVDNCPSPYLLRSPVFMETGELPRGKVENCKWGFEIRKHVGTKK